MGDVIPMRDYGAARAAQTRDTSSPWFSPAPDWPTCPDCPVRGVCREVRECQVPDDEPPPLKLRRVEPPDIIA